MNMLKGFENLTFIYSFKCNLESIIIVQYNALMQYNNVIHVHPIDLDLEINTHMSIIASINPIFFPINENTYARKTISRCL